MVDREDVCVLIPTLDEAGTIGDVVHEFTVQGFSNIFVIDGGSSDGTPEIALDHGARVLTQSGNGKGQAIREALEHIDADYVLMVDGDGTYRTGDADHLLEPVVSGRAEHVIGNRFADMTDGAMTPINKVGNRLINGSFTYIHGRNLHDILSGYRAFTRSSVDGLTLTSDGFGIETELSVECVKRNVSTAVVPIGYDPRPDESDTNLRPIRDGMLILITLYRLARTNNPLFFFGSIGLLSTLVGIFIGLYVGYRWLALGISHDVLAVVSSFGIIFGVQLIMFGLLSDLIVTLHREQMQRFDEYDDN